MVIEIQRLTPALINKYIHFHEEVAFKDNKEWAGCYCTWYHLTDEIDAECKEYEKHGGKCFKRDLAIRLIEQNKLQGYLAFVNGEVVGWCNANDRKAYEGLSWKETTNDKVKSVICYIVAPNMRRKGISEELLKKVCIDAKTDGYDYVEGYPGTGEMNTRNYHGSFGIYKRNGFIIHKDMGEELIVRNYFR